MNSQDTGISIVFAYLSERNIINMLSAAFGALLAISAILMLALRRLDIGLISLLPNIIPATMAFGLWGLLVGEIGLGLSVVVSMTLGIVVDDTVHFISKYLRARQRYGKNSAEAVQHAFTTVGPAMWTTTVALVARIPGTNAVGLSHECRYGPVVSDYDQHCPDHGFSAVAGGTAGRGSALAGIPFASIAYRYGYTLIN